MTTVTDPESREQRLVAHYRTLPFTERRRLARKASPEVRARLAYEEQQIAMDRSPGGLAAIITEGRELQASHLNMIDQAFKRIAAGEQLQVMLTCPPRHGKSQRVSRWGPLWYLRRNPTHRVMIASYGAELADDHGRWVRDQLKEYSGTLGIRLNPASHAANRFDLEQPRGSSVRGGMVTAGVGGGLTGKGFDLGIIDDPFKGNDDSGSPAQRDRVYDWYRSVFYTRRAPGASIILVNTRWHEDDLSGRLLQNEPHRWIQIDLPAIADSPNDPLGRQIGQALWPSQYDEAALADTRETLGERIWYSMYQQKPRPLEGGVWKWTWITNNRLKPEAWAASTPPVSSSPSTTLAATPSATTKSVCAALPAPATATCTSWTTTPAAWAPTLGAPQPANSPSTGKLTPSSWSETSVATWPNRSSPRLGRNWSGRASPTACRCRASSKSTPSRANASELNPSPSSTPRGSFITWESS